MIALAHPTFLSYEASEFGIKIRITTTNPYKYRTILQKDWILSYLAAFAVCVSFNICNTRYAQYPDRQVYVPFVREKHILERTHICVLAKFDGRRRRSLWKHLGLRSSHTLQSEACKNNCENESVLSETFSKTRLTRCGRKTIFIKNEMNVWITVRIMKLS